MQRYDIFLNYPKCQGKKSMFSSKCKPKNMMFLSKCKSKKSISFLPLFANPRHVERYNFFLNFDDYWRFFFTNSKTCVLKRSLSSL